MCNYVGNLLDENFNAESVHSFRRKYGMKVSIETTFALFQQLKSQSDLLGFCPGCLSYKMKETMAFYV